MPEKTVTMTPGQQRKLANKFAKSINRLADPTIVALIGEFAERMDKHMAQQLIECELPPTDLRSIIDSAIRHFELLNTCVKRASTGELIAEWYQWGGDIIAPRIKAESIEKCDTFGFRSPDKNDREEFRAADVCRAVGVSLVLIDDIYRFWLSESATDLPPSKVELGIRASDTPLQIIVDLLPFPMVKVYDYYDITERAYSTSRNFEKGHAMDLAKIREGCVRGKEIHRNQHAGLVLPGLTD